MKIAELLPRQLRTAEPYWFLIVPLFVAFAILYLVHLATGYTPPREAITIGGIDLSVYWYGIIIVGGIGVGAMVAARLAQQRAEAVFQREVPAALQAIPLAELNLPAEMADALQRRGWQTLGPVVLRLGMDARYLGLTPPQLDELAQRLTAVPQFNPDWLTAAPWRIWNPDHLWNGLIWCLVLGVIGARLYHVLTPSPSMAAVGINSPMDYFRNPYQLINLRNGGLGIYGGIAGGALGLALFARRNRIPMLGWADLSVIALSLGQAIGRWGNFFNQELYGRPTTLPWAVAIDPNHRLPAYADFATFHPAFLYESLWNLLTFVLLLTLARRYAQRLLPGDLTAVYLIAYAIGRTLLEMVRLDSRTVTLGSFDLPIAIATLVSLVIAVVMAGWLLLRRR